MSVAVTPAGSKVFFASFFFKKKKTLLPRLFHDPI